MAGDGFDHAYRLDFPQAIASELLADKHPEETCVVECFDECVGQPSELLADLRIRPN
jgi:hypothetical protein